MKRKLNTLLVAIILIGLPIYAYYFLSKGTQMRKDAMAELQPKGEIGNFQSVTDADSLFNSEAFRGKRWIVGVIGADSLRTKNIGILKNIYKQATEEFKVQVFTIIGLNSGEMISDMGKKFDLPRNANWIKTYMAAQHVHVFSEDAFSIPENFKNKNLVVLVNENGKILKYSALDNENDVKNLVREVPVFLSLK